MHLLYVFYAILNFGTYIIKFIYFYHFYTSINFLIKRINKKPFKYYSSRKIYGTIKNNNNLFNTKK